MKHKYSLIFITFLCAVLSGFGQTTVSYSFSAGGAVTGLNVPAPGIALDANIGFGSFKNSGTSNPALNSGQLRLYQNATKGGSIKIYASNGVTITKVVMYTPSSGDGDGPSGYSVDNTTEAGTFAAGGGTLTMDGLSATNYVEFYNKGTSIGTRTYVDYFEVTYTIPSTCTPPADPNGTITGTTPACTNTTLTYSGTTILGTIDYWQTTATGTSTANNATGTFNATATGTYYVRTFLTATSCWSAGTASYAVVINSAPSISTQPANATRVIPNNATFSVTATGTPTPTYQWQVSTNGGTTWNNVTGGSGATTNTYTTGATSAPMNGNQYRCVVTNSCGAVNSNAATLNVTNASPNNALQLKSCIANDQLSLSWNASSTAGVTGYIIFAQPNTTIPRMTAALAGNASGFVANSNYTAATAYSTLGKAVYKGAGTSATITGLTNASQYTFKVVAYTGETATGWASALNDNSAASSYTQTYTIDVPEVTSLAASINPTTSTVSWNVVPDSAGCYEYMVVANAGVVTLTPTGNGSAYTANPVYAGANQVVYKGTGNSIIVTGLTDAVEYCYTVFVREVNSGNQWSDGISVCQTTGVDYCTASGGTNNSMIKNVTFSTINQSSTSTAGYTDYTTVSTNVNIGDIHNLSVTVNTNGNYTSYVIAWIDWNRDGDFNDSGEAYELGTVTNNANGTSSASPFSITVPTGATIGNVRMRVSANSENSISGYATPCQSFTYGEVEDYTIIITQPANAEINVKGGAISIANGFDAPYGLNNTLFATTPLNTDSVEKEFTIENIGLANLLLTGSPTITLEGTNPTDFIVTQHATSPVVNGTNTTFRIKFHPTVAGTRTAKVRIENNDSDENPYLFTIEGEGNCTTAPTVATFPTSGPANTLVTFTSASSNLTGATISFNNIAVPTVSNTSDTIEVLIPSDANDGNFVIQLATGCSATQFFDVIDTDLTSCASAVGGGDATDLIIYEAYDENGGSGGVITIYNNTGASVNLSGYSIQRAGDYGSTYSTYANLSGTLAANAVAIISVSSSSCGYTPTGNGSLGSAGFNANDGLRLMNGTTVIDDVHAPNYVGYYLKRKNTNFYPNTTYTATEWTTQSLSDDECLAGVGTVPLVKVPPVVITHPQYVADCSITGTSLTVAGSEGVSGGLGLAYQWYVLGTSGNWTAVSNGGIYSGSTTSTLDISDLAGLDDYQYYCQIRENTATCYAASNAVKIEYIAAVWDGTAWSSPPTSSKIAIINGDYDTSTNVNGETSFEACQLFVAAGSLLTVSEGDYVEVINSAVVNGDGTKLDGILVEDKGSFVQRGEGVNAGTYTLNTNARTQVNKKTAPLNNYYEYTYWSSPVANETIENGLNEAHPTRRYWYNGQNYLDAMAETNNNNGTVAGQDDVDDNGDDWQPTSNTASMIPGVGYAAMHNPSGIIGIGINYEYTFNGALNTGDFTVPIYRNDSEMADNNWNFIGNPYPSAIDADLFLSANALIDQNVTEYPQPTGVTNGAIFLWSQNSAPSNTNNGNEALNFAQSDYAVINGTGQTAGGDGVMPSRFIPSGQGFFITLSNAATVSTVSGDIKTADVIFQNSMRVTGNNNQFFRNTTENQNEKLWLNFTSDMGVFNQILIGYVEGATNGNDDMYFDAPKNLSSDSYVYFYSLIEEELEADKVAIQGKAPESLNMDEIIPLGFSTTVNQATIYTISIAQFEGDFLSTNTIYLKDQLLNVIHNLSNTNYNFTSTVGEFNDRFEIVFRDSTLSVDDYVISNTNLSIIELTDNNVKFSIGSNHATIKSVEIIDMLGRTLYKFKGSTNTETYNLSNLSSATYIAKVTLSNNQVLVKKAVKK